MCGIVQLKMNSSKFLIQIRNIQETGSTGGSVHTLTCRYKHWIAELIGVDEVSISYMLHSCPCLLCMMRQ